MMSLLPCIAILPFMQDTTMAIQSKACRVVWPMMLYMYVGIGPLEADRLTLLLEKETYNSAAIIIRKLYHEP